ncbi:MAG: hypothetical protein AB7N65_10035 [Vicinamibacterales bacterium]
MTRERVVGVFWRRGVGAAIAVALTFAATGAAATVLIPVELRELTREAGAIVRGRVVAVDARWTDDRRGIETLVTLAVESYLKGSFGETLTFRVPGGRLGRLRSVMVGAPQFAPEQRVIVFLGHRGPTVPHVIGLSQGVYRITPMAGSWHVTPPALSGTGGTRPVIRGDRTRRPLPLDAFEAEVRHLVQPEIGR